MKSELPENNCVCVSRDAVICIERRCNIGLEEENDWERERCECKCHYENEMDNLTLKDEYEI